MLISSTTPRLTVRRISQHLGTREWNITRELQLGSRGRRGRLKGVKVTGTGLVGQGGQWQVEVVDYLDWLGMPEEDRNFIGDDSLPELHRFDDVAVNEKITVKQLTQFVDGNGLDYLKVGQTRYFSHLQRIRAETLLRAKSPASR